MLTIKYRQYCERCDVDKPDDGPAGDTVTSSKRGNEIDNDCYFAFLDSNGTLVPLAQTGKDRAITWFTATLQGRLFSVTKLICRQCGTINHSPRLQSYTGYGCLVGIILFIAALIVFEQFGIPVFLPIFFAALVVFIPEWLLARWLANRYRERESKHAFTQCCKCDSKDATTLYEAQDETLICPKCQHRTMHISIENAIVAPRFSLKTLLVVMTLMAIVAGGVTWYDRTYSPVTLEHASAEQANQALRGFVNIPSAATDVHVQYTPFSWVQLRFQLSEDESVKWCESNHWMIDRTTRNETGFFKFTTGSGGGTWQEGEITCVVFAE